MGTSQYTSEGPQIHSSGSEATEKVHSYEKRYSPSIENEGGCTFFAE